MLILPITKVHLNSHKSSNVRAHSYSGSTRYERLILIGTTSTQLYSEALKSAIAEAKRARDVGRYEYAIHILREIAPTEAEGILDSGWVDRTRKQIKAETDKLELELKGYKNNLIKESIRVSSPFRQCGKKKKC